VTDSRLGCRFRASWTEGDRPIRETSVRFAADGSVDAGDNYRPPPEVVRMANSLQSSTPSDVAEVLRFARERDLPNLYVPAGITFCETSPVYLDHDGLHGREIGRVLGVEWDGKRFSAWGWIHPDHAEAARRCAQVSPTLLPTAAEITQFEGSDIMLTTLSTFLELSATAEPARQGTTLSVGRPQLVPSPDWEALLTPESAFETSEFGNFRESFAARVTVGGPEAVPAGEGPGAGIRRVDANG